MMSSQEFGRCVHPRELPRFLLALFVALPIALLVLGAVLATSGLALAAILFIAFFVWFSFELWYAKLISNWVLVSEDNYPRLHSLLKEVQERVGFTNYIDIIVYEQKAFTSWFTLLFARRAIFIGSELLENGVTDDELRWLIGRHVGWMRARRRMGPFRYIIALVERLVFMNLLIYPYVRATHYTGDRVGLAVIDGNITTAISAFNKLMVGRELGYSINPAGIVRQYRRVKGSLFAFLARLLSPWPPTTARYTDLIGHAEREYPVQSQEFAAMNPSFQTSGGAWRLMWSTTKRGDSYSNTVGVLLFIGSIAIALGGVGLVSTGAYQSILTSLSNAFNSYDSYATTEEAASEPAPAAVAYSLQDYWQSDLTCDDGFSTSGWWISNGERVHFGDPGTVWQVGACSYQGGYWRRDIGAWSEDGYGAFSINWTQQWNGQSSSYLSGDYFELPVTLADEGGGTHSCRMRFTRSQALQGSQSCTYDTQYDYGNTTP